MMVMRIVALKIRAFKSESAIHSNMAEQEEEQEEEEEEEHQENPDETADQGIIPGLTRLCLSTLTFLSLFFNSVWYFCLNSQKL